MTGTLPHGGMVVRMEDARTEGAAGILIRDGVIAALGQGLARAGEGIGATGCLSSPRGA